MGEPPVIKFIPEGDPAEDDQTAALQAAIDFAALIPPHLRGEDGEVVLWLPGEGDKDA